MKTVAVVLMLAVAASCVEIGEKHLIETSFFAELKKILSNNCR